MQKVADARDALETAFEQYQLAERDRRERVRQARPYQTVLPVLMRGRHGRCAWARWCYWPRRSGGAAWAPGRARPAWTAGPGQASAAGRTTVP
ncbi:MULTISPECIES: hypothetical protein [Streptomyces]|uniref:hypothetical protein n=1 Tax=Streptomyces TaxID=1883 RepID=UPI00073DF707|nr:MULTISPECIES: hypothetical protein [unclassified Streptomyces]OYP13194.1 hypothetical protein CFC35_00610 [Streptomyces sp. FBKL.4005]BCM64837.1 hypothetical protein EASAB2608_00171 [Streptomyces sp. EAS-AB2608]CUW32755.1 hypothetical protein TUE45_pSRTUE45c_0123 [Streptomyces reticuli]